jgi:aspartyl-tRNA(Asn)/glutamyl-tRNA(Gln) amidotransferase subunit A
MTTDDLALLSADQLLQLYRRHEASPAEAVEAILGRIDRLNPDLHAYLYVAHDEARAQARAATEAWLKPGPKPLLLGVPVSVKDLVPTASMPTTFGSLAYLDQQPERNAPVVERLLAAGAVLLGKTNTPELGLIGATRNRLGPEGRNPWNLEHTPGGSSGGAAAAVAAGLGPLAVATDGAGSIRIPAAFCGVYGIKPAFGRIPTHERTGAPWSSTIGPIARTVYDAALFLAATAGPHERDAICLEEQPPNFFAGLGRAPLRGTRVAYSVDLGFAPAVEPEIAAAVEEAAGVLAGLGCVLNAAAPPVELERDATSMSPADEYAFDRDLLDQHADLLTDYALRTLQEGRDMPAWQYVDALRTRERYRRAIDRWFRDYDFFLSPCTAHWAGPVGGDLREINGIAVEARWPVWFTMLWNRTGHPAASIPWGLGSAGLPLAVQIVGRLGDEPGVLALSAALERERGRPLAPDGRAGPQPGHARLGAGGPVRCAPGWRCRMTAEDVLSLSIAGLARAYRQRELSPTAVTSAALRRIEELDGRLHSFITVTPELAMQQAAAAEQELASGVDRGPLHGVPIGLKDLYATKARPRTRESSWIGSPPRMRL